MPKQASITQGVRVRKMVASCGSESNWRIITLLAAIAAVAAGIRLYHLGIPCLWTDEGWSYAIATMPFDAMRHIILTRETNRGLYYLFLHAWITLGGSSETSLRLPSAVASVAAVPLTFACGRRLFNVTAGVIAALLIAVSPISVWYARDATAYSFEILFAVASLLFLLRAIERPGVRNLSGWTVSNLLAVCAHSMAVAAPAAQLLPFAILDRRRVAWRRILVAALVFAFLAAPLLWLIWHNDHGQVNWIPRLSWFAIGIAFFGVANGMLSNFSGHLVVAAYGIGALFGFAATIRAYDRSPSESTPFFVAASGVLFPFAFAIALSLLKPVLFFRYLIFCLPYLCLYVAGGIAAVRKRTVVIVCAAILFASSAWHTWDMLEDSPRYNWREAASYIMNRARRGDTFAVTYGPNRMLLEYYFTRIGTPAGYLDAVFPDWTPDLFISGRYFEDTDAQQFLAMRLLEKIDATAASNRRLWFVAAGESMAAFDKWASFPTIERRLSADYNSVDVRDVDGFTIILCSSPRYPAMAH